MPGDPTALALVGSRGRETGSWRWGRQGGPEIETEVEFGRQGDREAWPVEDRLIIQLMRILLLRILLI